MTAKRVGLVLAFLHAAAFLAFLIHIHSDRAESSQAALYWLVWFPVDFPWSFLSALVHWVVPETLGNFAGVPRYALIEIWRVGVHGLIGTIWWFYLPTLVMMLIGRRRLSR
jgi:hypothetical protein